MTQWDFLDKFFSFIFEKLLINQNTILSNQAEQRELIMSVKDAVQAAAVKISEVADALVLAVDNIRGDIQRLKDALVDASTPEEVQAILDPVLAKLDAVKAAAQALDTENEPVILPPPPPPDEPL